MEIGKIKAVYLATLFGITLGVLAGYYVGYDIGFEEAIGRITLTDATK